jgi:hypothetical protein
MTHQPRSRRTLLPLVLLLGGLLGVGPFVPHTLAATEPSAALTSLEIPGLAAGLGVALAIAALAGIAVSRRRRVSDLPEDDGPEVDPLLAALRGASAFAPDDLDARLGGRATVGSPASAGSTPHWVRRIDPTRPEPGAPDADEAGGWPVAREGDLSRS